MNFLPKNYGYRHWIVGAVLFGVFATSFLCSSVTDFVTTVHRESAQLLTQHHSVSPTIDACCASAATDHLTFWKSIAASAPEFLQYLLMIGAAVLILYKRTTPASHIKFLRSLYFLVLIQYLRNVPEHTLFNALKNALRKGILHPKVFSLMV